MKDITHFSAYFDAFEATMLDNNWDRIGLFFAEDMIYNTAAGEVLSGRQAAVDYLQADVDQLDRRFDSREFVGEPELVEKDGTVTMTFTVRYRKAGLPDLEITGKEVAIFNDGEIQQLDDLFSDETLMAFGVWMEKYGEALV